VGSYGAVIWEAGRLHLRASVPGRLVDVAILHQPGPVPGGRGSSRSTQSWNSAWPDPWGESDGKGPVVPHVAGAHQGLRAVGSGEGLVSPAWTGAGDSGGCGSVGMAEGWAFLHRVGLVSGGQHS
jgi:hypothetical protein